MTKLICHYSLGGTILRNVGLQRVLPNKLQLNITEFTNLRPKMAAYSLKTFRLFLKFLLEGVTPKRIHILDSFGEVANKCSKRMKVLLHVWRRNCIFTIFWGVRCTIFTVPVWVPSCMFAKRGRVLGYQYDYTFHGCDFVSKESREERIALEYRYVLGLVVRDLIRWCHRCLLLGRQHGEIDIFILIFDITQQMVHNSMKPFPMFLAI